MTGMSVMHFTAMAPTYCVDANASNGPYMTSYCGNWISYKSPGAHLTVRRGFYGIRLWKGSFLVSEVFYSHQRGR